MAVTGSIDPALSMLAQKAGILTQWQDAAGHRQDVQEPVLRNLLTALDLPCLTPSQISDSLHRLDREERLSDGDMVVVEAGQIPRLQCPSTGHWHLTLESGQVRHGVLKEDAPGVVSIPPITELGYHGLLLDGMSLTVAVVPRQCPAIPVAGLRQAQPWGLVAQIYSLREGRGEGDPGQARARPAVPQWTQGSHFGAVAKLAVQAADQGASALGLSPAHAMFSADPERYGPYSPSSRLFLNVGYGDPSLVLGSDVVQHVLGDWTSSDAFVTTHQGQLLDWPRIFPLRLQLLRDLFAHFISHGPAHLLSRFESFRREGGAALEGHACYEALHAHYAATLGPHHGWQDWPLTLRDPSSTATARFASQHESEIAFHAFAQWIAHESLLRAQSRARSAGMSIGLVGDLAIGTDPRGSHAWSRQNDILTGVSVGAPPDVYQKDGQNWGLTAFSPRGLRQGAYAAFIETLRATLRYSGGIRVDHVAGLERLWLVPDDASAAEGAYLSYPRQQLLGLLALEATRHGAIVVGENLGTVSEEFNNALCERGILGTSVLWFEREATSEPAAIAPFRPASAWSSHAVAMPTTHDLPTIHGWWQERDIEWKALLGQLTPEQHLTAQWERTQDRNDLWRALQDEGCVPATIAGPPDDTPLAAILSFVARTPSPLALFSMEDLMCVIDQPNMPGDAIGPGMLHHPNWVQGLPEGLETLFADARLEGRIRAIQQARSRQ